MINERDIRVDTYAPAVPDGYARSCSMRMTHLPTGLTAESCTRDRTKDLAACLASLSQQLSDPERGFDQEPSGNKSGTHGPKKVGHIDD